MRNAIIVLLIGLVLTPFVDHFGDTLWSESYIICLPGTDINRPVVMNDGGKGGFTTMRQYTVMNVGRGMGKSVTVHFQSSHKAGDDDNGVCWFRTSGQRINGDKQSYGLSFSPSGDGRMPPGTSFTVTAYWHEAQVGMVAPIVSVRLTSKTGKTKLVHAGGKIPVLARGPWRSGAMGLVVGAMGMFLYLWLCHISKLKVLLREMDGRLMEMDRKLRVRPVDQVADKNVVVEAGQMRYEELLRNVLMQILDDNTSQ